MFDCMVLYLFQVVLWVKQYSFSGRFLVVGCSCCISRVMLVWMFGWLCRQCFIQVWKVFRLVIWWLLILVMFCLCRCLFYCFSFCFLLCRYLCSSVNLLRKVRLLLLRKLMLCWFRYSVCLIWWLLVFCMLCQFLNDLVISFLVGMVVMVLLKFCMVMVCSVMLMMLLLVFWLGILIQLLMCMWLLLLICMLVISDRMVFWKISISIVVVVLRLVIRQCRLMLVRVVMIDRLVIMKRMILVICRQFLIGLLCVLGWCLYRLLVVFSVCEMVSIMVRIVYVW